MSIIFITIFNVFATRGGSAPRVDTGTACNVMSLQSYSNGWFRSNSYYKLIVLSFSHCWHGSESWFQSRAFPQLGRPSLLNCSARRIYLICGDQEVQKKSSVILRTAPNFLPAAVWAPVLVVAILLVSVYTVQILLLVQSQAVYPMLPSLYSLNTENTLCSD